MMSTSTDEKGIISAPHGSGNPFTLVLPLMTLILIAMGVITLFYFQKTLKDAQEFRSQAAAERTAAVTDGCVITGCNNEICTDKSTAARLGATTCVVRPEYVCLSKSVCRVGANNKCAWAQTAGYVACIADLGKSSEPAALSPTALPNTTALPSPSPGMSIAPSYAPILTASPLPSPTITPTPSPSPTSEVTPPSLADLNVDGKVDALDYQLFIKSFFKTGLNLPADLNHDRKVDLIDYVLFRRVWKP